MSHEAATIKKQTKMTASEMSEPARRQKQGVALRCAALFNVLHAYPVTLVLSCAASRCLRFKD